MKVAATLLCACLLVASPAAAEVHRFAVMVGVNEGDPGETILKFAEHDAERLARVLRELGGFAPEDVLVLNGVDADAMRRGLIGVNARLRERGGENLLVVFYSGHADAEALHLRGTRFAVRELRDLIYGSPARARVLMLDACRSGVLTRAKGGAPGPGFAINMDKRLGAEGVAILASSTAGEESQESDGIGGSFFTHYLASALMGAGDRNDDGQVSIAEAFTYASERTLVATTSSAAGPQHPTYRFDLGGREDLVLTEPRQVRSKHGGLGFSDRGTYLVHRGGPEGALVAEVAVADDHRQVTLPEGSYFVTQRAARHYMQGSFLVARGAVTEVAADAMTRVDFARVVRKGGTERRVVPSTFVTGLVRGAILDQSAAQGLQIGSRLDLSIASFELRLGLTSFEREIYTSATRLPSERVAVDPSMQASIALAALRALDLGPLTLAAGITTGGSWMLRDVRDQPVQKSTLLGGTTFIVGPLAQIDFTFWRAYARVEGALLTHFLKQADGTFATPVTYQVGAGFGVFF